MQEDLVANFLEADGCRVLDHAGLVFFHTLDAANVIFERISQGHPSPTGRPQFELNGQTVEAHAPEAVKLN